MIVTRRTTSVLAAALLGLGALSACSSDSATTTEASASAASSPAATAGCPLTVTDPWVKAQDSEMTGAFGVIANSGTADVTIASATSPQAGRVEIHEVVDKDGTSVMQPKEGGLVVPAGGSATLKPGSDHLMLMELPAPILAGDEVTITTTCDGGGTVTWTSVAKPFTGGSETYAPMPGMSASPTGSGS